MHGSVCVYVCVCVCVCVCMFLCKAVCVDPPPPPPPAPQQDFEKKDLPLPKALVDHKPEAAFTVASLSYKAAMFYQRYGETQKMLAAIERLPSKEAQVKFLHKHGFLMEAAKLMVAEGEAVVFVVVFFLLVCGGFFCFSQTLSVVL